jgi:hypothetical protein
MMSEQPYSNQIVEADFANFVSFLTSDPWFYWLWTLQQAFLCPELVLLTRRGEVWLKGSPGEAISRLDEIVMWMELLTSFLQDSKYNFSLHGSHIIQDAYERSGLLGSLVGSLMVLLSLPTIVRRNLTWIGSTGLCKFSIYV